MSTGTSVSDAMPPAPEAQPKLSEMSRLVNVYVAPTKTFEDIRRNASWWAPLLVVVASFALLAFAASQKVGWEQLQENRLRLAPKQAEKLDQLKQQHPDQYDKQMQIATKVTAIVTYALPVFIFIGIIVIAAILLATLNFGFGGDLHFGPVMAVVTYAHMPVVIKNVLAALTLFGGANPESFTMENPLASNLSFLAQPGKPLYTIGTALDVFTIWMLVLTGIGLACISKHKRGTTFSVVFGWWLFVTLIGVGVAAAFA